MGALLAAPAHAQPTPPPASADDGFGELTARWWTWVYDHQAVDVGTTNTFPILDTTGQFAAVGQENGIGPADKYFFLVGTFGGAAERTVTVPQGKALFFPIINIETDNAVADPQSLKVPALKQQATQNIDTSTARSATFDGKPVDIFRVKSPTFDYTVPAANSIYTYFGLLGPQFEGRIKPAVGDGYWSYIPPPTPGSHVLHFHSENPPANPGDQPFVLDVTYNLTVA